MRNLPLFLCLLCIPALTSSPALCQYYGIPLGVMPVIYQAEEIYFNNAESLEPLIESDPGTVAVYLGLIMQGQKRHVERNHDLLASLKELAKQIEDMLVASVQDQGGSVRYAGRSVSAKEVTGLFYGAINGEFNDWVKESFSFDPLKRSYPNLLSAPTKDGGSTLMLLDETLPSSPEPGNKSTVTVPAGSGPSHVAQEYFEPEDLDWPPGLFE